MDWFIKNYVYDTETVDYKTFFDGIGVNIYNSTPGFEAFLGIRTRNSNGKLKITSVFKGSAAEAQGLSVNDELIAVNGFRVDDAEFKLLTGNLKTGDEFEVLLSRDNILKTYTVKMGERNRKRFKYEANFDDKTQALFNYWLRVTE
jgi:predicted metalloprotease with PDZ domain